MPNKIDTQLTGAAGEHLFLSRLLSRGVLAAQAPRGARKADILVNFLNGRLPCLVQVKSRQAGGGLGWHMQEKHESQTESDLFFCFVDFEPDQPRDFVTPAAVAAEAIRLDHSTWLATPGKNGRAHNETKFRRLRDNSLGQQEGWLNEYLEKRDLIDRLHEDELHS
jgi:hypothetical protein